MQSYLHHEGWEEFSGEDLLVEAEVALEVVELSDDKLVSTSQFFPKRIKIPEQDDISQVDI